jgi:hypothetical protein
MGAIPIVCFLETMKGEVGTRKRDKSLEEFARVVLGKGALLGYLEGHHWWGESIIRSSPGMVEQRTLAAQAREKMGFSAQEEEVTKKAKGVSTRQEAKEGEIELSSNNGLRTTRKG